MSNKAQKISADSALVSIRNTHFIAKATFCMPQQTKKDRKAKQDAESINNAHGALDVRRRLYTKATMDPFTSIASACRSYLRSRATPLGDALLLAKTQLFQVIDQIENHFFVQWDQQRALFAQDYARVLAEAQQTQGFLFDATVYPDVGVVVSQFVRSFDIYPVGDIAGGLFDELESSLAADVAKRVRETTMREIEGAIADPLARLVEVIMTVHNKTSRANSRVHDSLMADVEDLTALVPQLNIVNLPMLNDMAARVRAELLVPTEQLKDKASTARAEVAEKSTVLLKELGLDPKHSEKITGTSERKAAAQAAAQDILSQMKGLF